MSLGLVMEGDASLPLLKLHRRNRWLMRGRPRLPTAMSPLPHRRPVGAWLGFSGYPCPTNEPAELAGGGGGSVDPSRAKQRGFSGSLGL